MEEVSKKVCGSCKEDKGLDDFPKDRTHKTGYKNTCKKCIKNRNELNSKCGIYKITSPTGKVYVGQSKKIKYRISGYKTNKDTYSFQTRLKNSFEKYGAENHIFEIIEECSVEELNCRERYWQDFYNVIEENGLNCILQECGEERRILSEETRKLVSNNMKKLSQNRKPQTKEQREKASIFWKAYWANPENTHPNLNRTAENHWNYGKKASQETKNKISNALKGRTFTEEHCKKISETKLKNATKKEKIAKEGTANKKVINTLTLEIFESIKDASISLKMNPSLLSRYLTGKLRNKTNLIFASEFKEEVIYEDVRLKNLTLKVINIKTNKTYSTIKEASQDIGMNYQTLCSKLKGYRPNNTDLIVVHTLGYTI